MQHRTEFGNVKLSVRCGSYNSCAQLILTKLLVVLRLIACLSFLIVRRRIYKFFLRTHLLASAALLVLL